MVRLINWAIWAIYEVNEDHFMLNSDSNVYENIWSAYMKGYIIRIYQCSPYFASAFLSKI